MQQEISINKKEAVSKGIASFYFEGILIGVDLSGTIFQEG